MDKLEGKTALVTGAAAGIGRATALAFSVEGARVIVADVDSNDGEETVEMIKDRGGEAVFVPADVSRATDVEALINKAVEAYGRIDCAANNAGINGDVALTADCTEENWDRIVSIDLKGVWLCMKYEIPQMVKQGGGTIVNTSSMGGLVGFANGAPAYVAAKHGVIGLTKTAALEYAASGIRVNAVCPGIIHTTMIEGLLQSMPDVMASLSATTPMQRIGQPEEVASAIVWLCTGEASFVTGHALSIDGGFVAQ
ncbi:MAG: SDR family oxidoreductase [Dehalococcoidia bacterium]